MSASLLYHGFGIRGYRYEHTLYKGGEVIFRIREDLSGLRCSACGSRDLVRKGKVLRCFRTVPIGSKPVRVVLAIHEARYALVG